MRWLSLIEVLESVEKFFLIIAKVLGPKKKFNINLDIIRSLVHLLRPFKFVTQVLQRGTEPSFHNVLVSVLTLRANLESASSLIEYETPFDVAKDSNGDQLDSDNDDHLYESEDNLSSTSLTWLLRGKCAVAFLYCLHHIGERFSEVCLDPLNRSTKTYREILA
jgi:hypothetical protein